MALYCVVRVPLAVAEFAQAPNLVLCKMEPNGGIKGVVRSNVVVMCSQQDRLQRALFSSRNSVIIAFGAVLCVDCSFLFRSYCDENET